MIKSLSFIIIVILILNSCTNDDLMIGETIRRRVEINGHKLISYKILKERKSNKSAVYLYTAKVQGSFGEKYDIEESLVFDRQKDGGWKLYTLR